MITELVKKTYLLLVLSVHNNTINLNSKLVYFLVKNKYFLLTKAKKNISH